MVWRWRAPSTTTRFRDAASAGQSEGEALMKQFARQVEKAEPDVIIEVDSDHFVNFFYNNLPSFCIGMAEEAQGHRRIGVHAALHGAPARAGQGAFQVRRE